MDESFLLQVINSSSTFILMLDSNLNVTFLNDKSKKILSNYGFEESYFKNNENPFCFPSNFIENNIETFTNGGKIKLDKLNIKNNHFEIDGDISALLLKNSIQGLSLTVNKIKDVVSLNQPKRRTFTLIRNLILETLSIKRKTINQVAKDVDVNWRTVESHLTHLCGKKFVSEVFCSEYVRIFDITEEGKIKLGIEKHKARIESLSPSLSNSSSSENLVKIPNSNVSEVPSYEDLKKEYEMSQEVQR